MICNRILVLFNLNDYRLPFQRELFTTAILNTVVCPFNYLMNFS